MSHARDAYRLGSGQIGLSAFRTPDPCMPATGQIAMSQLLCRPAPAPVITSIGNHTGYVYIYLNASFKAYNNIRHDLYENGVLVASNIHTGYKRVVPPLTGGETSVLSAEEYHLIPGSDNITYGTMEAHNHSRKFYWNGVMVGSAMADQTARIGNYIYYKGSFKGTIAGSNYTAIKRRTYSSVVLGRAYVVRAVSSDGYVDSNTMYGKSL